MKQQMEQDQAEQLRIQVQDEATSGTQQGRNPKKDNKLPNRGIDILNLPPRSEIHHNDTKNMRLKIKRPFIRFIVITIIVVLFILSIVNFQLNHYIDILDFSH